ncbi:MAG: tetratricopeptide repeat protein [Candidatus Latescibacterota bacterium]
MSRYHRALVCGVGCLLLTACAQVMRRPGTTEPAARAPSAVTEPGRPEVDQVSRDDREGGPSGASADESRARDLRRVNEYAWWCIDQGLWNEARSHLERALAQDSLSASLHNNLAIVYEHIGQRDQAVQYYRKAQELNPGQALYAANLKRLEQLREAGADTTGQLDLLDFRDRTPGPQREPRVTGD